MPAEDKDKLALFRSLFAGRSDVYAQRWDNPKAGKSGYSPACHNEWAKGICDKPRVKCGNCPNQAFKAFDDTAALRHLYAGKTNVRIYDYRDGNELVLSRMAQKRESGYRNLGYVIGTPLL